MGLGTDTIGTEIGFPNPPGRGFSRIFKEKAMLTPRNVYDKLAAVVAEGGFPALNAHGSCVYRTEDGKACAVGVFLTDEEQERAEGSVARLCTCSSELKARLVAGGVKVETWQTLPRFHDRNAKPHLDGPRFLSNARDILKLTAEGTRRIEPTTAQA